MKTPVTFAFIAMFSWLTACFTPEPAPVVFCSDPDYPFYCAGSSKCCTYPYHSDSANSCFQTLNACTVNSSDCETCVVEPDNPLLKSPTTQTWELTFHDSMHPQIVKVKVDPFTNSGTFSETSDSPGLWMFDPGGNACYKLPVSGNIVHDSPGDRWSFVGMSGAGCGMQTLASNSSGTANANFPVATLISNGAVTLTTQSTLGTASATVTWTGVKK